MIKIFTVFVIVSQCSAELKLEDFNQLKHYKNEMLKFDNSHVNKQIDYKWKCERLHVYKDGKCVHKQLLNPVTVYEIVGILVLMIIVGFSNAGGVGGGFLITPIIYFIFNYNVHKSIFNSYLTILGGSIGNLSKNAFLRNNMNGGSQINYDLVLISAPFLCIGSIIGVKVNLLLQSFQIIIAQLLTLLFAFIQCYKKMKVQLQKERNESSSSLDDYNTDQRSQLKTDIQLQIKNSQPNQDVYIKQVELISSNQNIQIQDKHIFYQQIHLFPTKKLIIIVLVVMLFQLFELISFEYQLMGIVLAGIIGYFISSHIKENHRIIIQKYGMGNIVTYPLDSTKRIIGMMSIGLFAGFMGGTLGLGGGLVIAPFWLYLDVNTIETANTSLLLVLITTITSSSTTITQGQVELINVVVFISCSLIGSYLIASFLRYYILKTQRQSIIIMILMFKIVIALIILPISFLSKTKNQKIFSG